MSNESNGFRLFHNYASLTSNIKIELFFLFFFLFLFRLLKYIHETISILIPTHNHREISY